MKFSAVLDCITNLVKETPTEYEDAVGKSSALWTVIRSAWQNVWGKEGLTIKDRTSLLFRCDSLVS